MVNTRRSETVSEGRRHSHYRTPGTKESSVEESSADRGSSDVDEQPSHEEESEPWSPKWASRSTTCLNNRVRELRNRFVCTSEQRDYSRSVRRNHLRSSLRSSKRLDMDNRPNRRGVFSRRNVIEDESEDLMDDLDHDATDYNLFTPHHSDRPKRRIIKVRSEEINYSGDSHPIRRGRRRRIPSEKLVNERIRSRAGLRPLKRECYADPNSPFSQELNSSDEKPDVEIRRSKRQRKFKYSTFNTSWITEHQMIRGYPKFKKEFSSDHEEDSKESRIPEEENNDRKANEILKESISDIRRTRTSNSNVNKKYVYKFLSRNSSTQEIRQRSQVNGSMESSLPSTENSSKDKPDDNDRVMNGEATTEELTGAANQNEPQNDAEKPKSNKMNDEDSRPPLIRSSRLRQRAVISVQQNDSDSTTEERHASPKYKLRQRKPKPLKLEQEETRVCRERRELPRRRLRRRARNKVTDTSSSDSTSSDDDDLLRKKHTAGNTSMQRKPPNRRASPPRDKGKFKLKDFTLDPTSIDSSITFKSIGGLDEQVRCLREMVVLPILYPEIFRMYQTNPPKGVLFHGPPGTGKTLMARALANECSVGNRKVTFFMRKGADLLSKWIGQTEKQMTLLFEQAAQMAPSIIFFDEIDGLAPARTARQEQVHVSVVASLLALMDGLDKSRGEVIVIGATNRLDALDPALRRPGRFDREIYFPLPSYNQRKEILNIILSEWPTKPSEGLITSLAERSVGYCGADLRALCTEAVLRCVRRTYPQIYESSYRLLIDPSKIKVEPCDFDNAASSLVPAGARSAPLHLSSTPPMYLEPLLAKPLKAAIDLITQSFPPAIKNISSNSAKESSSARLLISGGGSHLVANALLKEFEHLSVLTLDVVTLHNGLAGGPEEACIQVLNEARRNAPSILYLPRLNMWWDMANDTVKVLLQMMYSTFLTNVSSQITSILLLATIDVYTADFNNQILELFSGYRNEVLEVDIPTEEEREAFFRPLIIDVATKTPPPLVIQTQTVYEPLPRAPTPPPPPLSPRSKQLLLDKEEETLIELRIFLRDVCKKLASNKAFFMFTKPVDLEEVPDYLNVVEKPMDLETMMTKVDLHCYSSAQEFLMDIDLIQLNALTYNPDVTPADKQIRHRACWFRDYAYALIKAEMDTDFEENCRKIAKNRKARQTGDPYEFLPNHIRALAEEASTSNNNTATAEAIDSKNTEPNNPEENVINHKTAEENAESTAKIPVRTSPNRKRRVPSWAKGFLTGNRKKRKIGTRTSEEIKDTEEKIELKEEVAQTSDTELKDTSMDGLEKEKTEPDPPPSPPKLTPERRQSERRQSVSINKYDLNEVLAKTVSVTDGCSIDILCDLYMQLKLHIKKYTQSYNRQSLPQDLLEELERFQKHYY